MLAIELDVLQRLPRGQERVTDDIGVTRVAPRVQIRQRRGY